MELAAVVAYGLVESLVGDMIALVKAIASSAPSPVALGVPVAEAMAAHRRCDYEKSQKACVACTP